MAIIIKCDQRNVGADDIFTSEPVWIYENCKLALGDEVFVWWTGAAGRDDGLVLHGSLVNMVHKPVPRGWPGASLTVKIDAKKPNPILTKRDLAQYEYDRAGAVPEPANPLSKLWRKLLKNSWQKVASLDDDETAYLRDLFDHVSGSATRAINQQKSLAKPAASSRNQPIAIGEIVGIASGTVFASRRDLYESGVHRALQAGIVGSATLGAESIVLSGGYVDDQDLGNEIIYSGHGGRDPATGRQIADQTLTRQNQALVTSCLQGLPVRVIRGSDHKSAYSPDTGYSYDGLYRVESYWHARGSDGFLVCRFHLLALTRDQSQLTDELDAPLASAGPAPRELSTVSRIIRDTAVSRQVKELHAFQCQVCGIRLECEGGPYAEAAHIRPLGSPHHGPDVIGNVLCLCPNHHVLFDRGALAIADDLSLIGQEGRLRMANAHRIDPAQMEYQRLMWGR
jgi:putative restriction endonuclease